MIRNPTPLAAIKNHCAACCGDSHPERHLCPAESCSLHPWRHGKKPAGAEVSALKTIKGHCKQCGDEPPSKCSLKSCPLFPFKTGKSKRKAMTPEQKAKNAERLKAVREKQRLTVSEAELSAMT